ncbi:dr1-associated corepressor isoform X2 [Exaiptasia diaphana]|uniref:Dr1-associated corepressor n=1 Tax=Exaiptasia diaphana TaxID=2652724 RepID=A0A913WUE8_EXADI|nr:dr1-associated corepressor isoform X2 [Exaiptasia diaphana]
MPTKKKKFNARFPPARIKKIMQTDDDVGKVAAPVPVIISKALEMFLQTMVEKSCSYTQARNAKTLTTAHIKKCINSEQQFDFLKDLVEKIPDLPEEEEDIDGEAKPKRKAPVAPKEKEPKRKRKPKKEEQLTLSDDSEDDQEDDPLSDEEASASTGCHSNMALNSSAIPSVSSTNLLLSSRNPTDIPSITITKPEPSNSNSAAQPLSAVQPTFNHIPMMNSSKSVDDEDDDYDS